MVRIKVLGTGCPNCERLELHALAAIEQLRQEHPEVDFLIEEISDSEQILLYGAVIPPGLVVDGILVSSGRIPTPSQIVGWLEEALAV
jgi:hypothetical protein